MLDNTITLAVDLLNTGSTTDEDYLRDDEYQNRTVYTGPNHALDARDQMTVYRTRPKASGNFKGVAKSAVKFAQDVEVEGIDSTTTLMASEIGEISFALPVGTSAERAKALRQRMIAFLDDDTLCEAHQEKLSI